MAEVEEGLQTLLLELTSRSGCLMFLSYGFLDTEWRLEQDSIVKDLGSVRMYWSGTGL